MGAKRRIAGSRGQLALAWCALMAAPGASAGQASDVGKLKDFTLEVRVPVALENGPVLVESTVKYAGKEALDVVYDRASGSLVGAPDHWPLLQDRRARVVRNPLRRHMFDGTGTLRRIVAYGMDRGKIAPGEFEVALGWTFAKAPRAEDRDPPPTLADLGKEFKVHVKPRNPKSIAEVRKALEDAFDKDGDVELALTGVEASDLPDLVPLAVRLAKAGEEKAVCAWFAERLPTEAVRKNIFDILSDAKNTDPMEWVMTLHAVNRRIEVGPNDYRWMRECPNPLTRFACFVVFPDAFPSPARERLLAEAAAFRPPVQAIQVQELIERLESDDAKTRLYAVEQLTRLGPRATELLRAGRSRSPEQVNAVLRLIARAPEDNPAFRVVRFCKGLHRHFPNAVPLLEALAKNCPKDPLTQQAAEAIRELKAK